MINKEGPAVKAVQLNIRFGLMADRELLQTAHTVVMAKVYVNNNDRMGLLHGNRLTVMEILHRVYKGVKGDSKLETFETLLSEITSKLIRAENGADALAPGATATVIDVAVVDDSKDRLSSLRRFLALSGINQRFGEKTIFAAFKHWRNTDVPLIVQYMWLTQMLSAEHRASITASIFADGADGVALRSDLASSIERLSYDWQNGRADRDETLPIRQATVNYAMSRFVTQPQTRYSMLIILLLIWGRFGLESKMCELMDTYMSQDWERVETDEGLDQALDWDNHTHAAFQLLLAEGTREVSDLHKHHNLRDMLMLSRVVSYYGNPGMDEAMSDYMRKPNPFFPGHNLF